MSEEKYKYFELDMPSRLIPYKHAGVEKIEIRMLKGRDLKLLGDLTIQNFEKKFKVLLDNVLRGIDPMKLTVGDRLYLAMWIAINCESHLYPVPLFCSNCFTTTERYHVDLNTLEKVYLPEKFKEPTAIKLSNGETVAVRLLRVGDLIQYNDFVQQKGKDDLNFRIAQSLVMEGKTIPEKMQWLDDQESKDVLLLNAFQEVMYHGVKLDAAYTCPKCGGTGRTPVPFRLDLLFPDGETVARAARASV